MTTLESTAPDASPRRVRRRSPAWRAVAAVLAAGLVGGLLLALVVQPHHSDFGGGDPENYLFNGVRQARGDDAAYRFLPPEWERLPAADQEALRAAFLDDKARMYRLVDLPPDDVDATPVVDPRIARKKAVVDAEGDIEIAHDNLYSVLLSLAVLVDADDAPYLVNSVLAVVTAILLASLARSLTGSRAAWIVGVLYVALPTVVFGVRETRTEALAALLMVLFAWLTVRDGGRTAWPGLVLVALWTARHEFIVPLLAYLVWAGLRRRAGSWPVVGATVAAAYLFPWGPADAGDLFPGERDFFSFLPDLEAWALPLAFGALWLAADRLRPRVEDTGGWLRRLGARPGVHRAVWVTLAVVAVVAEAGRRGLEPAESGLVLLRGEAVSALGALVDTSGWPLVLVGLLGLIAFGDRLAGRAPWILAVVMAPQAMVLIRTGTSGDDLWNPARRFHTALLPLLLIGVALVVAELVRRAPRAAVGRTAVAALGAACLVGFVAPYDRLPSLGSEPDRGDAQAFHAAADGLGDGAVVVLDATYGSMSAQPTLRMFHGAWSFVAWDDEELEDVLPVVLGSADRPVHVEATLADLVERCGATVGGAGVDLPVEHGLSEGETVTLRPVTGDCGA